MRRAALLALALLLAPALAGCALPASTWGRFQGSLVLTYTLRNDSGTFLEAEPGDHCGTAEVEGRTLRVDRGAHGSLGTPRRLLVIDPALEGEWVTTGDQPIVARFPADVRPFHALRPGLATIDWDGDAAQVNGSLVTLPHEWTMADPGNWTATFRLVEGPTRLVRYGPYPCE